MLLAGPSPSLARELCCSAARGKAAAATSALPGPPVPAPVLLVSAGVCFGVLLLRASPEIRVPVTQANAVGVFLLDCSACNLDSTSSAEIMSLHHFNGVFLGCGFAFLGTGARASLPTCTLASCTLRFPLRAPCARLCECKLQSTHFAILSSLVRKGQRNFSSP